jgi:hypothetical protein
MNDSILNSSKREAVAYGEVEGAFYEAIFAKEKEATGNIDC